MTVTVDGTVVIPSSKTDNNIFVLFAQSMDPGLGQSGPYDGSGTVDLTGYVGPPNPLSSTPIPINFSDGYVTVGGFGFGYGEPNAGYSFTGIESSDTVTGVGPNPVAGVIVGYTVVLPEPATWAMMLLGVFGFGALLRRKQGAPAVA